MWPETRDPEIPHVPTLAAVRAGTLVGSLLFALRPALKTVRSDSQPDPAH